MNPNHCPGCKRPSEDDDQNNGDIITCIHCEYVGVWDEEAGGWRLLKPDEHRNLMTHEAFLEAIQFGMAFRVWRERDSVNLCALLHSKLDRAGLSFSQVDDLRDEIMFAGYHTHPTQFDLVALGIEKHGDDL